jgi:hypothetical protein
MIKYALQCDKAHGFESWFPSISSFETQARRGLVECPVCGSVKVEKQIMKPSVRLHGIRPDQKPIESIPAPTSEAAAAEPHIPAVLADDSEAARKLRAMMREIHQHVQANTEDVGAKFADEARKIHYGDAEERGIRGKATAEQAAELAEEGIAFLPLPPLPEERN